MRRAGNSKSSRNNVSDSVPSPSDDKEHLLKQILNLDSASIQDLLLKILEKQKLERIPLSLFDNEIYTLNEAIVKFLHENLGLSFKEISELTVKSNKTVWQLYQNAGKKSKDRITVKEDEFLGIPLSVLADSKLSTLEIVVTYLRDEIGMSWNIIAERLHRNYKTIWTTYRRAKKKNHG